MNKARARVIEYALMALGEKLERAGARDFLDLMGLDYEQREEFLNEFAILRKEYLNEG